MEWWKIIILGYVFLYIGLLIYQILDNRNKQRDKIKYAMERAELQDKYVKKMEKVKTMIETPSVAETAAKTSTDILSSFQHQILHLVYSIEYTIIGQIEWVRDIVISNIYIILRKLRIL
jgi:uncharacterized membrane-anchored protein YhcB (DUF1043 family)